jgi:hypothetical protein
MVDQGDGPGDRKRLPLDRAVERRTLCLVPFCKRSRKGSQPGYEWICADHWRLPPLRLRWLYRRAVRARRARVAAHLWKRIREAAIEIAAGIRR